MSKLAISSVLGLTFGIILEKSKVYLPSTIRAQMAFTNFTMLKVFMMAVSIGLLSFILLGKVFGIKRNAKSFSTAFNLRINLIGGVILGVGMQIVGSCPGTVLAQIGAGVSGSIYVLLGGLIGAATLGYVSEKINWQCEKKIELLDEKLKMDQNKLSVMLSLPILGGMLLLNSLVPWRNEISQILNLSLQKVSTLTNLPSLTHFAWNPLMSGVFIGLLQIPSMFFLGSPLGTSTSYETLLGLACNKNILPKSKKLMDSAKPSHLTQLIFTCSMILGAFLSVHLSNEQLVFTSGNSPLMGIIGGFLLLLGARLANGCTSGHGISGVSQLSIASIISTVGMFAGGILTSLLF